MRPQPILNKSGRVRPGRPDLSLNLVIHGGGVSLVPDELIAEASPNLSVADLVDAQPMPTYYRDNGR